MQLNVLAVGHRMPAWVTEGWQEYTRRMPPSLSVHLKEIAVAQRGKNADIARLKEQEGQSLLDAVPKGAQIVALELTGKQWSTEQLAANMESWMQDGQDVCFMIGGPDGLSSAVLKAAHQRWSLGQLTMPHPLVRVVLAEQLYRAWTITCNHPYHRA